ncbi:MAG: lysophospholipid acyltransferase family protein [Verrucomicrobiota bacterium]
MSSDEVTPAPPAQESAPPALLDLASSLKDMGPAGALLTPLASPLERLLGIRELNRLYPLALEQWEQEGSFFKASLRTLGVSYRLGEADMARFPKEGPLIIVSNHPFGMLDGLIVGAILEEIRPDFRLLGNRILEQIHPLRPWLISVNPFDQARGNAENARGLRSAIHWVKEGGALAVWPAGEVASLHLRQRIIRDPEWNHHCASLAQKGDATVVPLHFRGRNSWLFQGLGLVHPLLRTVLLARETLNKEGTEIPVSIGSPIPPQDLARLPDHRRRTRYLRLRTDILANRPSTTEPENHFLIPARIRHQETIIPPIPAERLSEEVASFSAAQCLLSYKQFDTFLFRASQAPHCLQEIGRLREISFRQEGEGSGKPCDLDDFDHTYEHLILWDREKNAIAGSYRIARTDQIVSQYGRQGLYTYSLFQFTDEFIDALTPALELGRSFIAPDYQRHHQTLLLLWRGVCAIAAEEPRYRRFFGPVSISNTYTQASKALITE